MKKQTRSLLIAAGVLVVMGGAYFALAGREETSSTAVPVAALEGLNAGDLLYTGSAGTLHFVRTDAGWQYADDASCPVDSDAVQALVDELTGLTADRVLETPDADSAYGLDAPDSTATLTAGDASVTVLFAEQDAATYIKADGTVYATAAAAPEALDNALTDWIAYESIPYTAEEAIESVTLNGVTVSRVPAETTDVETGAAVDEEDGTADTDAQTAEQWEITTADGQTRTIERDETIETLLDSVRGLYQTGCAGYGATDSESLAAYGLDAPVLTLEVAYTADGEQQSYTLTVGAAAPEGGYYAALGSDGVVTLLDAAQVDDLRALHLG